MSSQSLEAEIAQLLVDEGVVMLEFSTVNRSGRTMIRIVCDRKQDGITIDDCAALSREIRHLILEKKLLLNDFGLEVSSPGLDYPLREVWQFQKNLGRLLKIRVPGENGPREFSGRLREITSNGLVLIIDKKELRPEFSELLSAKVLPEFKPPRAESKP